MSGLNVVDQHTGQVGAVGSLQGDHEGRQTQVGGEVQLLDQRLGGNTHAHRNKIVYVSRMIINPLKALHDERGHSNEHALLLMLIQTSGALDPDVDLIGKSLVIVRY